MSEQNTETAEVTASIDETAKKERSASYPFITIADAIAFTSEVFKHYGLNNPVTREQIALKINKQPGSITRDVSAAAQYGFLAKEGKEGYKVTEIYRNYSQPTSDKERKLLLLSAFNSPKLYQELINRYEGSIVPGELPNALVRHHNIASNAAQHAAEIFIKNGQYVDAISDTRFLRFKDMYASVSKSNVTEVTAEEIPREKGPSLVPMVTNADLSNLPNERRIPIYLTKNKIAFLVYPSDVTKNDVKLIDHGVKGILLSIELEQEPEDKAQQTSKGGN